MRNSIFNEGLIEKETVLSSHILSADDDIASILKAIKENSKKEKVILENGVVKTTTEEGAEEKTTLSDHVVAGYWYNDYPNIYKFEKESLLEELESYKKSLIFEVVTGKRKVV